jgi:hypothetical protein
MRGNFGGEKGEAHRLILIHGSKQETVTASATRRMAVIEPLF